MARHYSTFGKIWRAIASFFVTVVMIFLIIATYRETVSNARMYTVPVTGIVQECTSYRKTERSGRHRRTKMKYEITVNYKASGMDRTYERSDLNRSYKVGEKVSLLSNPDTGDAVMPIDTKHNVPLYVISVVMAVCMLCYGIWLIVSVVRG